MKWPAFVQPQRGRACISAGGQRRGFPESASLLCGDVRDRTEHAALSRLPDVTAARLAQTVSICEQDGQQREGSCSKHERREHEAGRYIETEPTSGAIAGRSQLGLREEPQSRDAQRQASACSALWPLLEILVAWHVRMVAERNHSARHHESPQTAKMNPTRYNSCYIGLFAFTAILLQVL